MPVPLFDIQQIRGSVTLLSQAAGQDTRKAIRRCCPTLTDTTLTASTSATIHTINIDKANNPN